MNLTVIQLRLRHKNSLEKQKCLFMSVPASLSAISCNSVCGGGGGGGCSVNGGDYSR